MVLCLCIKQVIHCSNLVGEIFIFLRQDLVDLLIVLQIISIMKDNHILLEEQVQVSLQQELLLFKWNNLWLVRIKLNWFKFQIEIMFHFHSLKMIEVFRKLQKN